MPAPRPTAAPASGEPFCGAVRRYVQDLTTQVTPIGAGPGTTVNATIASQAAQDRARGIAALAPSG